MRTLLLFAIPVLFGVALAAEPAPPKFTKKPVVAKKDGKVTISFAVDRAAEVEVVILDASGKIVRNLASGIICKNLVAPHPLKKGLAQELLWDGKDDHGKPARGSTFKFRIRAGSNLYRNTIDDLKPGHWMSIPNSKIRPHCPPKPSANGRFTSIIGAWNSGAYDLRRDQLIITGGGHNDYSGNELYGFSLRTLKWRRFWGPSKNIPNSITVKRGQETYADGNPTQRHTYDGLEYLPNNDSFFMNGGSLSCAPGHGSKATWEFSLAASKWRRTGDHRTGLMATCAYDPVSGHLFMAGNPSYSTMAEYDPATGKWTKLGGDAVGGYKTAAIDYKRRLYIAVGKGKVFAFDLASGKRPKRESWTTTGDNEVINSTCPGLVYDPVSDRIVAWNTGADIYVLDVDKKKWTRKSPAAGNKVSPRRDQKGSYNRFRYVPSKNVFIVVNSIDRNVCLYRLTRNVSAVSQGKMKNLEVLLPVK